MIENRRFNLIRLHPRSDSGYVSQNRTVMATGLDGFIRPDPDQGLFVHQTRMLSCYRYKVNGKEPMSVALSNVEQHSWMGYYIQARPGREQDSNPDRGSGQVQPISEETIELRLSRFVGLGVHEDVELTNFSQVEVEFELVLECDGDFLDQLESSESRQQCGELLREWRRADDGAHELRFDYRAQHHFDHQGNIGDATMHRGLAVRIARSDAEPGYEGGQIRFPIKIGPLQHWNACIELVPYIEGEAMPSLYECAAFGGEENLLDRRRELFFAESTHFSTIESDTLAHVVSTACEQAKRDLAALRLYDMDRSPREWTMAAGLPLYIALFGRDTLTASWEAASVSASMMVGALAELPKTQGTTVNDWLDEEPGRMIHEAHTGPLATLRYNPRVRYYGSATTSKFYPVALAELWHWTGDKALVQPFIEPAMKCLQWMDEYADFDRDGFYEYRTHSEQGTIHQGWKDSRDAIVWADGSQVSPPVSTCEEQAYAYIAKLHMSELLWWLDRKDEARQLFHQAQEFKKRFNERFWWEQEQFFYMGLGPKDEPIDSVGSNVGHLLAAGIVDHALVQPTAKRFMQDDLFTGWGIRTLSSKHPAFNPYSYHRGSVWPVEHGTFAIGMMRFGLYDYVERVCKGMFEAAGMFDFERLPEVFSGHQRDAQHPFPALYPKTCWPQAWSASAIFAMVQSMLGLYPYAPLKVLIVDPHLPEWLPEITLRNLHVGEAVVGLRFWRREDGGSDYEVLSKRGTLHIVRQPSPWSTTDGFAGRIVDLLTSFLPRHV
ncbi:MAG TPA: glycogen debranching N-terminal domain-containing protein [Clostridia bacterium]|nr:glycogen debranching N-terminal domain-containing protein [Clostridia bacterium]